jgi:hypothetical protein
MACTLPYTLYPAPACWMLDSFHNMMALALSAMMYRTPTPTVAFVQPSSHNIAFEVFVMVTSLATYRT